MLLEIGCPITFLAQKDFASEIERAGRDVGGRVRQHALLDQWQLDQVLCKVPKLRRRVADLRKALEEAV